MSTEKNDRSMFIDRAHVAVTGGRGGDGACSFRREKYVPMGGPDGGNGGRGADVYVKADPQKKSLLDLAYRPHYRGDDGKPGMGSNKIGRSADDLIISVPVGTIVYRDKNLLIDLKEPGDMILVAKGGRPGRGNSAFKTQRNTAPMISERGEPGETLTLDLELKLLADIGLLGMPNAGKSTLLAQLTSARPKIANYPFTTLNPNLGVADWHGTRITIADIPGIIEGAHAGKGLGHDFLRHIERTRVLFHLVDVFGYEGQTAAESIRLINEELRLYSPALMKKPFVIVANKMDLTGADEALATLQKKYKKTKIISISAATGQGVQALLLYASRILAKPELAPPPAERGEPLRFVVELDYHVVKEGDRFVVSGAKVERLAAMTNFSQQEGVKRFQNILKKMGVEKELARQGAESGDPVHIGSFEFFYEP